MKNLKYSKKYRDLILLLCKKYLYTFTIPMALALVYYVVFSADRYVSETVITVRDTSKSSSMGSLALLTGMSAPASREDNLYLKEYIHSFDMLQAIDQNISLRQAYTTNKIDPFYAIYSWNSQETFLNYYKARVEIVYDDMSGLLRVMAEGFTPQMAQDINKQILHQSEIFVNELSHKMAREELAFAQSELQTAQERLSSSQSALLEFQNKHGVYDPLSQAQAKASMFTELEASISKKEAELGAMQSYLQESAPSIIALKSEIEALKTQAAKEKSTITSKGSSNLNTLASEYQNLLIKVKFAEDAYAMALQSVEATKIEVQKKLKHLAVIQSPVLPQSAIYPEKLYNLITIFVLLLIFNGIINLIKATIEDHK